MRILAQSPEAVNDRNVDARDFRSAVVDGPVFAGVGGSVYVALAMTWGLGATGAAGYRVPVCRAQPCFIADERG